MLLVLVMTGPAMLAVTASAQGRAPEAPAPAAKLDKSKLSYAIGFQIGDQFSDGKPDVDIPTLVRAIQDAYAHRHPTVSTQQMHEQLQLLSRQMHSNALTEYKRIAADNARKSTEFLASNQERGCRATAAGWAVWPALGPQRPKSWVLAARCWGRRTGRLRAPRYGANS
ncbi:MAG: hypothetical protein WDW38_008101 [Sanguina aurantia]